MDMTSCKPLVLQQAINCKQEENNMDCVQLTERWSRAQAGSIHHVQQQGSVHNLPVGRSDGSILRQDIIKSTASGCFRSLLGMYNGWASLS